jgi:hypothetical protein
MPWRCPACQTPIRHSDAEDQPRANVAYRCHVCRLELVFDEHIRRLTVAPMRADGPDEKSRNTR